MKRKKEFDKIDDSCGEVSLDDTLAGDPWSERIASKEYDSSKEHPTPEQLMLREALKCLTREQRVLWEFYAYDKLTHDEIAAKLRKERSTITRRIATIEKRMAKWVQSNLGAYNLLKGDLNAIDK